MSKRKRPKYYCIECLRKYGYSRVVPDDLRCPFDGVELRTSTPQRIAQIVTRLTKQRGIAKPPTKTKDDYTTYLQSDLWRLVIRPRVLARDNEKCFKCGGTATCVHHCCYDKDVMDGLADDQLKSLCRKCHEEIEFRTDGSGKRVKNSLFDANVKLHGWYVWEGKR